jgi:hypothetical protein
MVLVRYQVKTFSSSMKAPVKISESCKKGPWIFNQRMKGETVADQKNTLFMLVVSNDYLYGAFLMDEMLKTHI